MDKPAFRVIGLMAGSSHDGVDVVLVRFWTSQGKWRYEVLFAETIPYPPALEERLHQSLHLSGEDLLRLSIAYTDWTAQVILENLRGQVYDLISWHGPTVFHQPGEGLTWSLGDPERLRTLVGRPVVTHFRAREIALGGQGAPLIPHADAFLWPEYETLLNLGGIANITHHPGYVAFDVSPCNQLLNALARQLNPPLPYDPQGRFARQGKLIPALYEAFFSAPIFQTSRPTAITNEAVQEQFLGLFLSYPAAVEDKLHTALHAIAGRIGQTIQALGCQRVYLTGGGAHNSYLVEALQALSRCECLLPPKVLIDFREAIGFAFLGLRRYWNEDNLHKPWTQARQSLSAGVVSP